MGCAGAASIPWEQLVGVVSSEALQEPPYSADKQPQVQATATDILVDRKCLLAAAAVQLMLSAVLFILRSSHAVLLGSSMMLSWSVATTLLIAITRVLHFATAVG